MTDQGTAGSNAGVDSVVAARRQPPGHHGRLADIAYNHIKTLLVDGQFNPGARVQIQPFVKELGMSRQPIMEALKRLATEGFLEIVPQVGCRVAIPEKHEIADFFRMFALAEALCAECAAARRSDDELERLTRLSQQIGALIGRGLADSEAAHRYRGINREFHRQIHVMARSATIGRIAEGLWDLGDFYIGTALGTSLFAERLESAHDEHEAIRRAIADRDPPSARDRMQAHILAFGNRAAGSEA